MVPRFEQIVDGRLSNPFFHSARDRELERMLLTFANDMPVTLFAGNIRDAINDARPASQPAPRSIRSAIALLVLACAWRVMHPLRKVDQ
jgi:hypothetical protein